MLNAILENENKSYTNISIFSEIIVANGVCCHDLWEVIKILVKTFLFSIIVFNKMKLLAIRHDVNKEKLCFTQFSTRIY